MSSQTNQGNTPKMTAKAKLYDIHCPSCGAPAYYDIKTRVYHCRYCGMKVGIDQANSERKGFREIQKKKMQASLKSFELQKATCTGCGAQVVFDKGDATASCAFCGRALVRKQFLNADTIPELVIPFRITKEEAQGLLEDWCRKNAGKKEAKELLKKADQLKGFYLPYELVRGPVECSVSRMEDGSVYDCGGFIEEEFVNCSGNLDNLLLDAMEPFDLEELTEFDFAYVAGHGVKVGDITGDELERRVNAETAQNYKPVIQKTLEAKAVYVKADASGILRMPVLLPVYYLAFDGFMAAVNGQTGKVSVRAVKDSHYYVLPWWLKAILATVLGTGGVALGLFIFGAGADLILETVLLLGLILLIVMLAAYSDNLQKKFRIGSYRKVFTSKTKPMIRVDDRLTEAPEELVRPVTKPVFFLTIEGKREAVELKFTSLWRVVRMILMACVFLFLPVIIALFLNGFNFAQIELGGSAAWFCLSVPLTPVFIFKFGRIDLYNNPWIYLTDEKGHKKRYHEKVKLNLSTKEVAELVLTALFKPPVCFAVWFGIACFCTMCYLTAFGFE